MGRIELFTIEQPEGYRAKSYGGVVDAHRVVGLNFMRDFFHKLRDFIGGRVGAFEAPLQAARAEARAELAERAERMGMNAVVGIRSGTQVVPNGRGGGSLLVVVEVPLGHIGVL